MRETTGPQRCPSVPGGTSSDASHLQTCGTDERAGDSGGSRLDLQQYATIRSNNVHSEAILCH